MKSYPSISTKQLIGHYLYLFDKLDGSNIRIEWSKQKGFYKFGSRNRLIDENTPILGEVIDIFNKSHSKLLHERFLGNKIERAICFGEFYGPSSFAGSHKENEPKKFSLFDISIYKKGFLNPKEFLEFSKGLEQAQLLYEGFLNEEIISKIKTSTLDNMSIEGVVAKAINPKKNGPLMFKIKSQAWLDRLKDKCGNDENLFNKLK